jgi:uncharacterized membrane protein HdeD (DUF308 family)
MVQSLNEVDGADEALQEGIRSTWWVPLLQGVAALLVGVSLLATPPPTLSGLTIVLGAYWLASGIFDALGAVSRRVMDPHAVLAFAAAVLSVSVGLLLLAGPMVGLVATSLAVVTNVASGAIVSGIFSVAWGIRVRRDAHGDPSIILLGLLSILLGLLFLASPLVSAVAIVQGATALAIAGGIAGIIHAFRLRSILV